MEITMQVLLERSSVRTYSGQAPTDAELEALRAVLAAASEGLPFGTSPRFELVTSSAFAAASADGGAQKIGTYGVIKHAPLFLVGAVRSGPGAMVDYGYAMEDALIAAAALGLGSCWLAGTFSRTAAARALMLQKGELIPAVSPLGRPAGRRSLVETVMRAGAGSARRKSWAELFWDGTPDRPLTEEDAGPWAQAFEAVRRGPSASNKQPWRVARNQAGNFELLLAEDAAYNRALGFPIQELDMGIALRRFDRAADILGHSGFWTAEKGDVLGAGGLRRIAVWRTGTR